jgi:hypothetical protein
MKMITTATAMASVKSRFCPSYSINVHRRRF